MDIFPRERGPRHKQPLIKETPPSHLEKSTAALLSEFEARTRISWWHSYSCCPGWGSGSMDSATASTLATLCVRAPFDKKNFNIFTLLSRPLLCLLPPLCNPRHGRGIRARIWNDQFGLNITIIIMLLLTRKR